MDNRQLAESIIELSGGKENITQHWHCITRLRFNLVDDKRADLDKISRLDGVIGSQFSSGQFQVIIGAKVEEVYEEIDKLLDGNQTTGTKKKIKPLDVLFDIISGIFTPILPAIVGAGMLKGILSLFVAFHWISTESSTYSVLNIISDATYYFLPFLVAMTAARKFKTKESLALTLAGILLYPTIINGSTSGASALHLWGMGIPLNNYSSSVLPIILGVLLLSFVNKWTDKFIPKSVNIVFSPLLSLIITAPLLLAFIAPLGNVLGAYLEGASTALFHFAGPLAGFVLGGLMPIIVISGMHYAFFPSALTNLQKLGYDTILFPMNLVANIAQVGATLGVLLKAKNSENKSLAASAIVPALFGITEPAIYGVTLRLRRPFYASLAGGAVGGTIFGTLAVKSTAFAIPGIASLPTYIISGTNNFLYALIGYLASFSVAFIVTLIIGFEEEDKKSEKISDIKEKKNITEIAPDNSTIENILAPLDGTLTDLTKVSDQIFSQGLMGKGIAIMPLNGEIISPFDGIVTMTTPSNHAIGITSDGGVDLLIHVGIDTVNLNGKYFERKVEQGKKIKKGDELLRFDLELIKSMGYDITTIIIVTNTMNYLDVIPVAEKNLKALENKILVCVN